MDRLSSKQGTSTVTSIGVARVLSSSARRPHLSSSMRDADRPVRFSTPLEAAQHTCVVYKAVYIAAMDRRAVVGLRRKLGLTQQAFASLLGLSFVSVNKWENGGSTPTGLSAVLLELLASALRKHAHADVIHALRATGGAPLEVIRVLTAMERENVHERT